MPTSLANIKNKLDDRIGEKLMVIAQAGRKKRQSGMEFFGKLTQQFLWLI
ncbi:hypothetical protein UCCLB521_0432 [Levilactobacillus brevis]|nr:hypothetical protein UCCLB521_0432 [Levilactobacillus brevis]